MKTILLALVVAGCASDPSVEILEDTYTFREAYTEWATAHCEFGERCGQVDDVENCIGKTVHDNCASIDCDTAYGYRDAMDYCLMEYGQTCSDNALDCHP